MIAAIAGTIPRFTPGKPFPGILVKDRKHLSIEARREIQSLMRPAPGAFVRETVSAWAVIAGAIGIASRFHSPFIQLAAMIIIATRQNILGLLIHDQAHFLGFRSQKGELLTNLLVGYPLLMSVESYANVHLAHHNYFFTEKDPDYSRKQGEGWTFPVKKLTLFKTVLKDLLGLNVWKTIQGKRSAYKHVGPRKTANGPLPRIAFNIMLAVLFTVTKTWRAAFLFWFLPLFTFLQVIIRWGALCEHKYNLMGPSMDEATPFIKLKKWEKILLPNLNFTYHIYHHYYPGIPFSNLPKVHKIFQRERMINELNVFRGYGSYLHFMLRDPSPPKFIKKKMPIFFKSPLAGLSPGR